MSKGSIQISAATGGGECGGSFILTEVHGVTCTGISAGVAGLTGYNVQIAKMAWGQFNYIVWYNWMWVCSITNSTNRFKWQSSKI